MHFTNKKQACPLNYLPMKVMDKFSIRKFKHLLNLYVMRCAIWHHLYYLKNLSNTHGGMLILIKLQDKACNFAKSNTLPWVFLTFFKFYKRYQTVKASHINIYTLHIFKTISSEFSLSIPPENIRKPEIF